MPLGVVLVQGGELVESGAAAVAAIAAVAAAATDKATHAVGAHATATRATRCVERHSADLEATQFDDHVIPGKEAAGVLRSELFEELLSGGIDHLDTTTRDSRVYTRVPNDFLCRLALLLSSRHPRLSHQLAGLQPLKVTCYDSVRLLAMPLVQ